MRLKRHILRFIISLLFLILIPVFLANAGHGGSVTEIGRISTDGLVGFNLWIVNLFNDHRLLFTLFAIIVISIEGILFGYITDYFLKLFGIKTSKMEHKE